MNMLASSAAVADIDELEPSRVMSAARLTSGICAVVDAEFTITVRA
jgi:hypothetical protein